MFNRLSSVAVNQSNWKYIVFNFLEHRHDADSSIVCPENKRGDILIEESYSGCNFFVCEEKVKLLLVKVAVHNQIIETKRTVGAAAFISKL